jgi:hypothetical protein
MATKRNQTNPDAPADWSLSEQQLTAIDLLVTGRNLQDTAAQLGVQRPTVSLWVHHHPGFQAALNKRRQELWTEMAASLRALVPEALEVLQEELTGPDRLAAAVHVLKAAGLYGVVLPPGPSEPEVVAAEMRLAEDARQHAHADAALTIERRAQTRFSDQFLNSLQPGDVLAWAQTGGETS